MPDFQIRETSIVEPDHGHTNVELIISDNEEVDDAGEYVSISVIVPAKPNPLLATLQLEALRRAQAIIEERIQVIAGLSQKTH